MQELAPPGNPKPRHGKRRPMAPRYDFNFLLKTGAGDGIRTHDPNLGKVVLYP
jgi:hypothetical protein